MSELPIVLLLLLVVALLARMDLIFYLVYVLAGTYALSRWWAGRSIEHLRVHRRFTDHIFAGESTDVEIEIVNVSWWPVPWLRYEEIPPTALVSDNALRQATALHPKGRSSLNYSLGGQRRGYYQIGPGVLSTGDLFGFSEFRAAFVEPRPLIVYPRVVPLTHVDLSSHSPLGTIKTHQPIFADPSRMIGMRDYRSGDSLRVIAWKNTAHAGCLQVKKLEPAVSLTAVIFVDLNAAAYSRQLRVAASEWAIVVAASLANYLVAQRQAVGLASNGLDLPTETRGWLIQPRPGRVHLMKLLEWLARVQLTETTPLSEWLPIATAGLPWGTTVVIVTPSGDEATCNALHRLRRAGLNPVLVAIEPHAQFGVILERGRRLGVSAFLVADESDLRRWQGGRTAEGV